MEQQEQTTGYALETHNKKSSESEQLVEYFPVKDTPFTVAKNGKEWYVLMGKYRLTEAMETKEEAMRDAKGTKWMRIMQVIQIMLTDHESEKTKAEEANKNQLKLSLTENN